MRPDTTANPGQTGRRMGPLKPFWLPPGTLLGQLGTLLGRLAALLGRRGALEAVLDVLWVTTGALVGCLGTLLGSGGRLGHPLELH